MKLRRVALILILTIVTIMLAGIFSESQAAIGSRYLTIKKLRESGYGYEALEKVIWKICESNSSGTTVNYDHTIYCLKGGPGFGNGNYTGNIQAKQYTRYFDMKDISSITGAYADALPSTTSNTYKSLLWLLENIYVAPKSTATAEEIEFAEEYREELLERAGIAGGYITDDDIDAVQQLAIWHFTNDDEYKIEKGESFELWINAVANSDSNYNPLSDYTGIENGDGVILEDLNGWDRAEECQELFDYLVETATEMATEYDIEEQTVPYELANLVPTQKVEGNNYIVGPFRINKVGNVTATFTATITNGNEEILNPTIQNEDGEQIQTLPIEENFYIVIPTSEKLNDITVEISGSYYGTTLTYWSVEGALEDEQPVVEVERGKKNYYDYVKYVPTEFDLSLRKFITSIENIQPTVSREPQISDATLEDLSEGRISTAVKTHPKNALLVENGDIVVYTIRVYNEGNIDGYVREITDYLPTGLKLLENSEINNLYCWKETSDGRVTTDITSPNASNPTNRDTIYENRTETDDKVLLKAFDTTSEKLDYIEVKIECEVVATVQSEDTILKNIAEITAHSDSTGDVTIKDLDSTPNNVDTNKYGITSQEDDDDFEQLVIIGKYFDLSLRKFITSIEDEELKDNNGKYLREPIVNVTPLLNGKTTAIYNHDKTPINVDVGDVVIYTIRVYNEGQIDGYVHQITDHLPEWLEFINDEFNASYGWKVLEGGRTVITDITSPNTQYSASRDIIYADRTDNNDKVLLKAFDTERTELDYIEVKIKCKVKDSGIAEKLTNIAEITKYSDSQGNDIKDRDNESFVTLPKDSVLPEYKDDEINRGDEYIPGQEDDDDFEKVIVQKFDLSLRKFITGVNDTEITNRVPSFSIDSNNNMKYTHTKTPVEVASGDVVIYTLRIYNEGNQAGYAETIKDDLPEGLEFLPDNELNKTYRWKMYKEDGSETTDVSEAVVIETDYLSKEQGEENGRNNLLKAFNKNTMTQPDYKDIKIAFKVTEPNTSDRILINIAEISNDCDENGDEVEDIDSTPNNDKDGEDDIDIEKVKVKYFDLALEKIISSYSMKLDGKTTVTKTGHEFGVQPEPVVKIELGNHKIETSVIKFTYKIKVTNEGEIAGYATEVKDYIPEGLKFVSADNKNWKLSEDGKTVTTDQLKDTLLQPGESAVVQITLQWINGQNNLGLKQNWAEISDDRDENGREVEDIDSTPDNYIQEEDDIDDASVVLTINTGATENYIILIGGILAVLSTGIVLIKKFVI